MRRTWLTLLAAGFGVACGSAEVTTPPASDPATCPVPKAKVEQLSATLRATLLAALPKPLYDASPNWGKTVPFPNGVKWHGLRPETMYGERNDGKWRKVTISADEPVTDHLVFNVRDVRQVDGEAMA